MTGDTGNSDEERDGLILGAQRGDTWENRERVSENGTSSWNI